MRRQLTIVARALAMVLLGVVALPAEETQPSSIDLGDPRTGELLRLYFTDAQRQETGAATAPRHVEASADPSEWLQATGASHWRWVPLGPVASDDK